MFTTLHFKTTKGKERLIEYRKIPNKPRGLYFSKALFEELIFGGAYLRREICVSKSIGLACSGKEIYHFCFVLLCIRGQIPSTSPPGSYIRRGDLTEGFLRYNLGGLIFGGACTWRGLFSEFYGRSATREKIHSENTVMTETPGELTGSQPITGSDSVYGADCPVGHLLGGVILLLRVYDPRPESFRVLLSCAM